MPDQQPPTELLPLSKHERVNWPVWLKQGELRLMFEKFSEFDSDECGAEAVGGVGDK